MRSRSLFGSLAAVTLVTVLGASSYAQEPARAPAQLLGPEAEALADGAQRSVKVQGEIVVLHATNTNGGIDPRIGTLPELQKPPFSAYNTYRLLSRQATSWTLTQADSTQLPNGRVLKTTLKAVLPNDRFQMAASISQTKRTSDKEEKSFLPLLEVTARSGETFFVAGQSYQGGILVVGIRVGPVEQPGPKK